MTMKMGNQPEMQSQVRQLLANHTVDYLVVVLGYFWSLTLRAVFTVASR